MGSSVTDPWGVLSSLLVTAVIGFAIFLVWCFLRVKFQSFFARKRHYYPPVAVDGADRVSGIGGILKFVISCPESAILQTYGGIDQVLYLRFMKYSMILFGLASLFGLIVLIPINTRGQNQYLPDGADATRGLDTLSVSNIESGSSLLWAHIVFLYLFTGMALYFIHKLYQSAVELKALQPRSEEQMRTIFVHNLPRERRSGPAMYEYMLRLYGGERVVGTLAAPKADKLRKERAKRNKIFEKWRNAVDVEAETGKRQKTWTGPIPCTGSHEDAIDYYGRQLQDADAKLAPELGREYAGNGHGFVVFDNQHSAALASQAMHETDAVHTTTVEPAPDPNDVYWRYLSWSPMTRTIGTIWAAGWMFLLFVFWTIPVGFIAGLSNLDNLAKIEAFSWLIAVVNLNSFVKGFIQGFLASYALILFFSLLPWIIKMILKPRGYTLRSKLEVGVMTAYWAFLLLNVFLVYSIAGSLLSNIQSLTSGVPDIVGMLAVGIPAQATFFINYVVVHTFKTVTLDESLLISFLVYRLKRMFLIKTQMQKLRALQPPPYMFTKKAANSVLVWGIVLTFSVLSPLILPFAFFYFAIGLFWARHNMIFLNSAPYQGLNATPRLVTMLGISLVIFQLTTAGVLGLKEFSYTALIFLPIVVTLFFIWGYTRQKFARPHKFMALSKCPQTPQDRLLDALKPPNEQVSASNYVDPVLAKLESPDVFSSNIERGKFVLPGLKDNRMDVPQYVHAP